MTKKCRTRSTDALEHLIAELAAKGVDVSQSPVHEAILNFGREALLDGMRVVYREVGYSESEIEQHVEKCLTALKEKEA